MRGSHGLDPLAGRSPARLGTDGATTRGAMDSQAHGGLPLPAPQAVTSLPLANLADSSA